MIARSGHLSHLIDAEPSETGQNRPQHSHRLDQALDYILGSKASSLKRNKLARYLQRRATKRPTGISFDYIEGLPRPRLPPIDGFSFNHSLGDLLSIAEKYTRNRQTDIDRVMRYAVIMDGIRIGDSASLASVTVDDGYEPGQRFPRVTGSVHRKRLSMRVVPDQAWGGPESPHWSPFALTSEDGKRISIGEYEIARVPFLFFGDSIHTIAYLAKGLNGQYCITVNPLQNCSHDCIFCCRSYGNMQATYRSQLINLTPSEMAKYLRVVFPNLDFLEVIEITFITGVFPNDAYLLKYVEEFLQKMIVVSDGRFDPRKNDYQRVKVSSHLLRTKEAMRAARALGMKRFTYTVELVDPCQRAIQMDLAKPRGRNAHPVVHPVPLVKPDTDDSQTSSSGSGGVTHERVRVTVKGSSTFDDVMGILATACRVFGQHEVEPVLVVGLDTYDDTMRAVRRLHAEGYKMVTRALLNAYGPDQVPLYRMTLAEAIAATEFINEHFMSGYRQVLDITDNHVKQFNPIE